MILKNFIPTFEEIFGIPVPSAESLDDFLLRRVGRILPQPA
jgi:hypothetical protein